MINQNWWFTTLLTKQFKYCPPLNRSIKCDVLKSLVAAIAVLAVGGSALAASVVWGGMPSVLGCHCRGNLHRLIGWRQRY